jgi:hypothetical protein
MVHNMMVHNMMVHNMMVHNMMMHNMVMHNMVMHNMVCMCDSRRSCHHTWDRRAESSRLFESGGLREATAVGAMALGQGPYI